MTSVTSPSGFTRHESLLDRWGAPDAQIPEFDRRAADGKANVADGDFERRHGGGGGAVDQQRAIRSGTRQLHCLPLIVRSQPLREAITRKSKLARRSLLAERDDRRARRTLRAARFDAHGVAVRRHRGVARRVDRAEENRERG